MLRCDKLARYVDTTAAVILYRSSDIDDDEGSESPLDDASKEPEMIMPLRNKIAVAGSELKLACRVYCPGKVTVEWYKDQQQVNESDRISFDVEDELHTIHISNLEMSDGGQYKAIFKNKYGIVETKSELTVEGFNFNFMYFL